jgi:hypothetical protein
MAVKKPSRAISLGMKESVQHKYRAYNTPFTAHHVWTVAECMWQSRPVASTKSPKPCQPASQTQDPFTHTPLPVHTGSGHVAEQVPFMSFSVVSVSVMNDEEADKPILRVSLEFSVTLARRVFPMSGRFKIILTCCISRFFAGSF